MVSHGVTLTIEPGTVIKLNGVERIQIAGTLIARGTVNEPVIFTSENANPTPGNWGAIEF